MPAASAQAKKPLAQPAPAQPPATRPQQFRPPQSAPQKATTIGAASGGVTAEEAEFVRMMTEGRTQQ